MNGGHFSSNVVGLAIQSCSTPCDPMDCSPPGSSVHGILQARILEWAAISFSIKYTYYMTIPFNFSYSRETFIYTPIETFTGY